METRDKITAYFQREQPFSEEIGLLRRIVLECGLEEAYKWNAPVYCLNGKNVLGIMAFKAHCGLWFFNGVFLTDPLGILENAQEGKTRAMRHWKFKKGQTIDPDAVKTYIQEAIQVENQGLKIAPKETSKREVPPELEAVFREDSDLRDAFNSLPKYKKNDFCEYIASAKKETTKQKRLQKIIPMISSGTGLNDQYRK